MFTKKDLKDGMFGLMGIDRGKKKFVFVDNKFIYQDGLWDALGDFTDDLIAKELSTFYRVIEIKDVNCFNDYDESKKIIYTYKPHLENVRMGYNFGIIGEETKIKLLFGDKAHVGDLVEIYNTWSGEKTTSIVCKQGNCEFIMGHRSEYINNGCIINDEGNVTYQIRKFASYESLKNGQIVRGIKVVK